MESHKLTAAGPVCINHKDEILLVKKGDEHGWGFTGGKVSNELKDSSDFSKLMIQAVIIHEKNTGTDLAQLEPCSIFENHGLVLDYIEPSKNVRLVHFLFQVPDDFLKKITGEPKHHVLRFFSKEEIKEMQKAGVLLPNVIKVLNVLENNNIL